MTPTQAIGYIPPVSTWDRVYDGCGHAFGMTPTFPKKQKKKRKKKEK